MAEHISTNTSNVEHITRIFQTKMKLKPVCLRLYPEPRLHEYMLDK